MPTPPTRQYRYPAAFAVTLGLLLGLLLLLPTKQADAFDDFLLEEDAGPVTPRLIAQTDSIQPGQTITVAVHFELADKWHLYWKNPGGPGYAPGVEWTLPEGYTVSAVRWPAPHTFDSFGNQQFGHEEQLTLLYELTAPAEAQGAAELKASLTWLVCDEQNCKPNKGYPKGIEYTLSLAVSDDEPKASADKPLIDAAIKEVPTRAAGWSFKSKKANGVFELTITAPTEKDAAELDGLYFFSEQPLVVDYKAKPQTSVDGKTVTLKLTERTTNEYGKPLKREKPITELSGVLTAKSRFGKDGPKAVPIGAYGGGPDEPGAAARIDSDQGNPAQQDEQEAAAVEPAEAGGETMGLSLALGMAFLGGMILNLMPCVFPVLSIKILGFVKLAGEKPHIVRRHGYAFGIGVMVSFWVLIAIILILRQSLDISWGFQLQNPVFVLGMILLCFLVGLNLLGTFEFGVGLSAKAGQASQTVKKDGYGKSFFTGVLATLIATPCAAPFMAPAIGAAFVMPDLQAFAVFSMLGLGMATPYVLLSCFPILLNYLPKPGPWMESFKQAMAFPMFATAGWLCLTYIKLVDIEIADVLLMSLAIIALGIWVYGKWTTPIRPVRTRWIARGLAAFFILFGLGYVYSSSTKIITERIAREKAREAGGYVYEWVDFSPEVVDVLRAQGRPILIDFTASWCAVCQDNKRKVLRTDESAAFYEEQNMALIEADFTAHNSAISKVLKEFRRDSVPLYLVYPPGDTQAQPVILSNRPSLSEIKQAVLDNSTDEGETPAPSTAAR